MMKTSATALILGLSLIIATAIGAAAFKNRNQSQDIITVTGLGSTNFTSDLIVWNASFSKKDMDLKMAYKALDEDRDKIKAYLNQKGIKTEEVVFSSVDINRNYRYIYDENGNQRNQIFDGYNLRQDVQIESKDVNKVEELSRSISELINQDIELYSQAPSYYYTKLAELKIEMIAQATQDAKTRAEQIAENAGAGLGNLKKSDLGVFQIIGQNSSDEYSWGGSFNTADKHKTANITVKLVYQVD